MQRAEIGIAIDAEHDRLAVEDELFAAQLVRGLDNPGEAVSPIVAALGDEAHALAVPDHSNAVAVMLDLVGQSEPVGTLMPLTGMANSIRGVMSRDLSTKAGNRKLELVRARHGVSPNRPKGTACAVLTRARNIATFAKFAQRPSS